MPSTVLSGPRAALVDLIKRQGEVSVEEAAERLELAVSTLRHHFRQLEELGVVERHTEPQGRGRPRVLYRLSEQGQALFPSGEGRMLRELVGFLLREGHLEAVQHFFEEFWERRRAMIRVRIGGEGAALGREEKVRRLARFLREEGFMPEIDVHDQTIQIRECNCPFEKVVEVTRLPCRLEARFLEEVIGCPLERVEYIAEGHAACTYQFKWSEGGGDEAART